MNVVEELRLYLERDVLINPDPEESAQVIQDPLSPHATPLQYLHAICISEFFLKDPDPHCIRVRIQNRSIVLTYNSDNGK